MKIFVSSTFTDLKNDRGAVAEALNRIDGIKAVRMEDFSASDHPPVKVCLDHLADCDGVVLLLGFRYGSIDPERGLSVTEIEYRTAKELGITVFPFIKKNGGTWHSTEPDAKIKKLHEDFKERVEQSGTRDVYETIDELKYGVETAIHDYRIQNGLIGARVPVFQAPEQFFHKFTDCSAIFNHTYSFVGRQAYLEQLVAFPGTSKRVLILPGRGGIGKTRLLKEALEFIASSDGTPAVRMIREGVEFTTEIARQLPLGSVLIVADDVQRLEGLPSLLAVAQEYPQRIKLMLVARPHGLPRVRSQLAEAGFNADEIEQLPELGDLSSVELQQLALEVLGSSYAHYADALVAVSRDAPLVTVVGGRLLSEEHIPPGLLANSEAFRFQVFDKLAETYTEAIPDHVDKEHARQILDLIAALAPFRPDHTALVERVADFLGLSVPKFNSLLAELERVGIVRQVGFSLRIAPDILSDFFLEQACLGVGGNPTNYADELFEAFWPLSLENLLRNLAELDWRIRQNPGGSTLLMSLWSDLQEHYLYAQAPSQYQIVNAIASVAYIQPRPALDFAQFVIEHLEPDAVPDGGPSMFINMHDLILRKLSAILNASARYESTIRESLDRLWELRNETFGEPGKVPEHPIRVLEDLATFEFEKPEWVYDTILNRINVWLGRPDAYLGKYSPLDILDGSLKRESATTWTTRTEGRQIHWRDFQIPTVRFGRYRRRAFDILEQQVMLREEPLVQVRILKSLIAAVWSSHQLAENKGVGLDELAARQSENERILQILDFLLSQAANSILKLIAAEELYQKVLGEPLSPREEDLRQFLKTLRTDGQTRLTQHLWKGYYVRTLEPGLVRSYHEGLEATTAEANLLVRNLLKRFKTAEAIKQELESILSDVTSYGENPEPGPFLAELTQIDSTIGAQLAELVITDHPQSQLTRGLIGLILPLRDSASDLYQSLLGRMVRSSHKELVRLSVVIISKSNQLTEFEIDLLGTASKLESPDMTIAIIGAFRSLIATDPEESFRQIARINIGDDPKIADFLCGVLLDLSHDKPQIDLPDGTLSALLGKFVSLWEIGESLHHLHAFLNWFSKRDPISIAEMFLKRISRARALGKDETIRYRPVPYASFWKFPTHLADANARQAALRLVRDTSLDPGVDASLWLSDLFVAMAGGWDDLSLTVLIEWLESGQAEKITRVAYLLRQADADFVFSQEAFTIKLLKAADTCGAKTLDAVSVSLRCGSGTMVGSGTPGQPMQCWIDMRDRAKESRSRYPLSSAEAMFYEELEKDAVSMIKLDQKSWEEDDRLM